MSFIKNYGLYWERERINWGKRGKGNKGSLIGYTAKGVVPIDFSKQAGIYVLYEGKDIATSRPVYVGQVGRRAGDSLLGRLKDQAFKSHLWNRWSLFSWFGMFEVGKANDLVHVKIDKSAKLPLPGLIDHLEGALITLLEPPLNKRGANWHGAKQYFQDDEDNQGRLLDEVKAIRKRLEDLEAK
ncbi:MAG TPA: hypothetical protein VHG72_10390 [Polyangia bacterium]|nr:hypothetical protein [Polyangia bacterium]